MSLPFILFVELTTFSKIMKKNLSASFPLLYICIIWITAPNPNPRYLYGSGNSKMISMRPNPDPVTLVYRHFQIKCLVFMIAAELHCTGIPNPEHCRWYIYKKSKASSFIYILTIKLSFPANF